MLHWPATVHDPAHEAEFDRITRVATRALNTPVAQFNVIDADGERPLSSVGPPRWSGRQSVVLHDTYGRQVVSTKTPFAIADLRALKDERNHRAIADPELCAYAAVPVMLDDGTVVGSLCVADVNPRAWTDEDQRILADLAWTLATRIQQMRQSSEHHHAYAHLELTLASHRKTSDDALRAVNAQLEAANAQLTARVEVRTAQLADAKAGLHNAIEQRDESLTAHAETAARFRSLIEHTRDLISLVDAQGKLRYQSPAVHRVLGYPVGALVGTNLFALVHPEDQAKVTKTFERLLRTADDTETVVCRLAHTDGSWRVFEASGTNLLDDHAVGAVVINAHDVTDREYAEASRRLGAEALRDAQVEVVDRLAQTAEFRDTETGDHTRRVGVLSARIARALGLSEGQIDLIRHAAPLHDIGKIAIPDPILRKPSRLTAEEYAMMQTHAAIGAKLLSGGSSAMMQMSEDIARSHHERWDGKGYPAGLAGEAIPLAGRIVAVADFYDALTSDRPYRQAWTPEDTRAEIARESGAHFDPRVVAAFCALAA